MKRWTPGLILLVLAQLASVWASSLPALNLSGAHYVSLPELARALGLDFSDGGSSFTLRTPEGILTGFAGSPDVLWQPRGGQAEERSLVMPIVRQGGRWYLPEELLGLVYVRREGSSLLLPGGSRLELVYPAPTPPQQQAGRWEVVTLAPGAEGLSLYAPGRAGADTLSLTLVDPRLLARTYPDLARQLGSLPARTLYFVLLAVTASPWENELLFTQGGRSFQASHPDTLQVLSGDARLSSPEAPVAGLIFLPDWFDLSRPVTVRWTDISATFQFRR